LSADSALDVELLRERRTEELAQRAVVLDDEDRRAFAFRFLIGRCGIHSRHD
jgi:hypothetical protein